MKLNLMSNYQIYLCIIFNNFPGSLNVEYCLEILAFCFKQFELYMIYKHSAIMYLYILPDLLFSTSLLPFIFHKIYLLVIKLCIRTTCPCFYISTIQNTFSL